MLSFFLFLQQILKLSGLNNKIIIIALAAVSSNQGDTSILQINNIKD
jgi:hypothetical protein